MKNSFDEKIIEEANDWIKANQKVVLATVIQTWGSSPRPTGSRMIVNENGDFSGSVSGGCVESAVVRECIGIIKDKKSFKKIEFKVSNESAWEVGLACGGEISSLFRTDKLKYMIERHKKYINWWKNFLKVSDYGLLWISFIKGLIIGLLIYHFFII